MNENLMVFIFYMYFVFIDRIRNLWYNLKHCEGVRWSLMEKIDMERASEELEYLDALIEKYQSKLQTITVNDIFKQ